MINVKTIFDMVSAIVVQATSGNFTIDAFNNTSLIVQTEVYSMLRKNNGNNIEVINALLPFKKIYNPVFSATGIYNYPSDYFRYITAPFVDSGQGEIVASILSDDEWAWRSTSNLVSRIRNPIVNFQNGFIRILPATGFLRMYYFKKLTPAVYGAIPDANGDPIYNAGTSVDFEFDEAQTQDLVIGICQLLAINIEKTILLQYFNQYQK